VVRIERDGDHLRLDDGAPLVTLSPTRVTDGDGSFMHFDMDGGALLDEGSGPPDIFERVPAAMPALAELEVLAGTYSSGEAETTFNARVRDGALELTQRPATVFRLAPLYADAFESGLGTIIFHRDAGGHVTGLSVVQDRVWDLRFRREPVGE